MQESLKYLPNSLRIGSQSVLVIVHVGILVINMFSYQATEVQLLLTTRTHWLFPE